MRVYILSYNEVFSQKRKKISTVLIVLAFPFNSASGEKITYLHRSESKRTMAEIKREPSSPVEKETLQSPEKSDILSKLETGNVVIKTEQAAAADETDRAYGASATILKNAATAQPEVAVNSGSMDNVMDVKVEENVMTTTENSEHGDTVEAAEKDSDTDTLPPEDADDLCPRDTGFTSENFKIEITNLPRKFGFKQLKKRLSFTLGLRPHKLKAIPHKAFAFVCFSCEEDREAALKVIGGHVWKGRELQAKKAQPAKDPMKRKHDDAAENASDNKKPKMVDDRPPDVRLKDSVTPLWKIPYEEQLETKTTRMRDILRSVASNQEVRTQFMKERKLHDGMCCPLLPITPSPVLEGYRNKSEFSIGRSDDGTETVVGFRFGLYRDGTDSVASPTEISVISPESKTVVQCFQDFIRSSKFEPFDHRTHRGHWRQLTVRTSLGGGGIMAIAEFVLNNATQEEMQAEKDAIKSYFTSGKGQAAGITTLYFRPCSKQTSNSTSAEPYELIFGDGHICESLMDMKFRISPSAFFQVNTVAAEVLYKLIADWCKASPSTTVLDICCGTGTIGLSLAQDVKKVIGIEMCKEAVEDAKYNAQLNGITNCTYHCAKVQDVIQDVVQSLRTSEVVAVLDPPRAGMPPSVIKSLRACRDLKRIVYAACHPQIAKPNFIDLTRPSSKKLKGEPFKFVHAMPVDLFPQTNFCELLVLFERDTTPPTKPSDGGETK